MQDLVAGPRAHLTEEQVLASLDPRNGGKVDWGVEVLDETDTPTGEEVPVDADEGGEVRWSYRPPDRVAGSGTDVSETRRTGSLVLIDPPAVNVLARRFLVWVELNGVRWDQGVFVCGLPRREDDGRAVRWHLDLADKTYLWRQPRTADPDVVTAATNVLELIADELFAEFGETPDWGSHTEALLDEDMFVDAGTPLKVKWDRLLEAVGWDALIAREDGTPTSTPLEEIADRQPEETYSPDGPGYTAVAASVSPMLPDLPNEVRFVARQGPSLPEEGNGWTTRRNPSTGPGSIEARGGRIISRDVTVQASDQSILEAIADADAQRYFAGGGVVVDVEAALYPRLSDRDVVRLTKPRLDVDEVCLVTDWTLRLGRMTEAPTMPLRCEARVAVAGPEEA